MDFYALNYSLLTLCLVAAVSFFLGRWSKSDGPGRHGKPIGENRSTAPLGKSRRPDHRPGRGYGASERRELSREAVREVEHLLGRGKLIAAIKVVRRDLGIGLKEAKDYIDNLKRNI